jgi:hypothetical protein
MGTNYYLRRPMPASSDTPCGYDFRWYHREGYTPAQQEQIHLGKSSYGWVFALHVYPNAGVRSWDDVQTLCRVLTENGWVLVDEYGDNLSVEDFIAVVTDRDPIEPSDERTPYSRAVADDSLYDGVVGLWRSRPDGQYCLGNGTGTWDFHFGSFS